MVDVIHMAKIAVAATLSWLAATAVLGHEQPFFAPLAALLTVQATVYESVTRGAQRIAAVLVGVALALVATRLLGSEIWALAAVIFIGLMLARGLHLGPAGSVHVPLTAIVTFAVGAAVADSALARVEDTLIGAVVALIGNALIAPPVHVAQAERAISLLLATTSSLIDDMGRGVARGFDREESRRWLLAGRALAPLVTNAANAVQLAELSLRWNASGRSFGSDMTRLRAVIIPAERIALQARSVARALDEMAREGDPIATGADGRTGLALATLLAATARAIIAFDNVMVRSVYDTLTDAVREARERRDRVLRATRPRAWSTRWAVRGAAIKDTERMIDEVARTSRAA